MLHVLISALFVALTFVPSVCEGTETAVGISSTQRFSRVELESSPRGNEAVRYAHVEPRPSNPSWGILRISGKVNVRGGHGQALLSVSVNERTALQTVLDGHGQSVTLSTVTISSPEMRQEQDYATDVPLRLWNYAQEESVVPGLNEVGYTLATTRGNLKVRVVVRHTRVQWSEVDPDYITIGAPETLNGVEYSSTALLVRVCTKAGHAPTEQVLRVRGLTRPLEQTVRLAEGCQDVKFAIPELPIGQYRLEVGIDEAFNTPHTPILLYVSHPRATDLAHTALGVGVCLLLVGAVWLRRKGW